MNEDTYAKLASPFQTFKKSGLDYITGEQVATRLNEVLGWNGWNFRVLEHGMEDDQIWVLGQLEVLADGLVTRQQFGSQVHQKGELGDDLKAAATDALKKCATLVGVGLYLSEKDEPAAAPARTPVPPPQSAREAAKAKPTFWEVVDSMNINRDQVRAVGQEMFSNMDVDRLSKENKGRVLVEVQKRMKEVAA